MSQSTQNSVSAKEIVVNRPAPGQNIRINTTEYEYIKIAFGTPQKAYINNKTDLIIEFADGARITLVSLIAVDEEQEARILMQDGSVLSVTAYLAMLDEHMATALQQYRLRMSSGLPPYDDDPGELIPDLPRLGMLGTDYWGWKTDYDDFWITGPLIYRHPSEPGGSFNFSVSNAGAAGIFEDDQPDKNRIDRDQLGQSVPGRLNFDYSVDSGTSVVAIRMVGFLPGTQLYLGDPHLGGLLLQPDASGMYTFSVQDLTGTGIFIVPPLNDDTDMPVTVYMDIESEGGRTTVQGSFVVIVDAVADKPQGTAMNPGDVDLAGDVRISDAGVEERHESGWSEKNLSGGSSGGANDADVSMSLPVTLEARFFDFDGSETHSLYLEVPEGQGWSCEYNGIPLEVVTDVPGHEGTAYFRIPAEAISYDSTGKVTVQVTLRCDNQQGLFIDDSSLQLDLLSVAVESPTDQELRLENNVAVSEGIASVTIDTVNSGLSIRTGWASEGGDGGKYGGPYMPSESAGPYAEATDGGDYANIAIALTAPVSTFALASSAESISLIVLWCAPEAGRFVDESGNPLPLDSEGRVNLSGPNFISSDGQSLVTGSVRFQPATEYSDADLEKVVNFQVTVTNEKGASVVFTGSTGIVVDAVADRPDNDTLEADYGDGFVAGTPGAVIEVKGGARFYDIDGSEYFYAVLGLEDSAWNFAGLDRSRLLSADMLKDFWREQGGMPAEGENRFVDEALDRAAGFAGDASQAQYLMLQYDPASGETSAYAVDVAGGIIRVELPGLSLTFNSGRLEYTIRIQSPEQNADQSAELHSWAVSLEKASGGMEYDYSNNISLAEDTGSALLVVEALTGTVSASLSMHEDGMPGQYMLAEGGDPATGPRDESTEDGYDERTGIAVDMRLNDASEGEYVHSITIGELPDPVTQGVIYYQGNPVAAGQIINAPEMGDGNSIPGFSFKPVPNFSGDVDFNFSYIIGSHRTGPSELPGQASFPMHVDSVADLASGESDFGGRTSGSDSQVMPDASLDGEGWSSQLLDPEQSLSFTFTVQANFTDLDGSETAWIDVLLPQGFGIPSGSGYQPVMINGQSYARIAVPNLETLQADGGRFSIDITLNMDASAADDAKSLQIRIVTHETDGRNSEGHSTDNNTATRVLEQEVPLSVHSGLSVKAGWASEDGDGAKNGRPYNAEASAEQYAGATDGGRAALIDISLIPREGVSPGDANDESISSIVVRYDSSMGSLVDTAGNQLGVDIGGGIFEVTLSGSFISSDGQSLVPGSVLFRPAGNRLDGDLTDVIRYEVNVDSVSGEKLVFSGSTSVVVDAVADRPDNNALTADYGGEGEDSYIATTPGGVVDVSGSAAFHDLDGSELLYAVISVPDSAWGVAGLGSASLLSKNDITGFWRGKGNMPAENEDPYTDTALTQALDIGAESNSAAQYLLIEYDPATGIFSAYANLPGGDGPVPVFIEGLTVFYENGVLSYTVPIQTPSAQQDGSLTLESLAVSLEKATGGMEYDYSNNIAVSEDKGSVTVEVEVLVGRVTASLSMHEDGLPDQNKLAENADPATGPRDESLEPGYAEPGGMPIAMLLEDAAPGEYLHSITMGALPDALTQGVIYYLDRPVTAGQVIENPDMGNGGSILGFSFKPAPNFSGNVDFNFSYTIASHRTGPSELPGQASYPMQVDSVADLASGESDFTGRASGSDSLVMPDAVLDGNGWAGQLLDAEQNVNFTFTIEAEFSDLDGSEIAWIDVLLPQGFNIPFGSGYEPVTNGGQSYARIPVPDLAGLQADGGRITIPVTLNMDASATDDAKTLQISIVTHETDNRNSGGHTIDNNTATRVIEQEVPLSVHSGLNVQVGWVSEDGDGAKNGKPYNAGISAENFYGATDNGQAAPLNVSLIPRHVLAPGEENDEFITGIVIRYDSSRGSLVDADGNQLGSDIGGGIYEVTLSGNYISADGQSLAPGSVFFVPAANRLDADLTDIIRYEVNVDSVSGEELVFSGSTTIVVDAVADRPDNNILVADYGRSGDDVFTATTPGGIVLVNGSAEFYDLDGSEFLYTVFAVPDSAWSVAGLEDAVLLSGSAITDFWRTQGNMPQPGSNGSLDMALAQAISIGTGSNIRPQYLLLEYDPATNTFTVYAAQPGAAAPVPVNIEGLTVSFANGVMHYTIPIQTPSAQENTSLVVESQAVSLEKASGDTEYDYSNNIAVSEDKDSVTIVVETLTGKVTASLSMHEDAMPDQNKLAENADPATGPRDENIEPGYDLETGMPVVMHLEDAAEGEYVHSITIGELPDPATQGVIYYNGREVTEGQVIETPLMGAGNSIPGFSFKPAPNFSGDADFRFSFIIGSHTTGPAVLPIDGTFPVHVDSVADLASGTTGYDGRIGNGNSVAMPDAVQDGAGWMSQQVAPEQSVRFTVTIQAVFTDLDGSENAWIDVELPEGFSIPSGVDYEPVTQDGVNYARIPVPALETLQISNGRVTIPVTLQMDGTAEDSDKILQVRIVTEEQDQLDSDGHSTGNNTAVRVIEQEIPLSVHSGLTVKAGWASEDGDGSKNGVAYNPEQSAGPYAGATNGGSSAEISLSLTPRAGLPEGEPNNEFIDSIVISYDASMGVLLGYDGQPLSTATSGTVSLILTGTNYISPNGQSLVAGSLRFQPRANLSDADLENVIEYTVNVSSVAGESVVYQGKTSVVIDAVADRPDNGPLSADYGGDAGDDFVATTPGGVVNVSGSAEYHDLDGSELLYVLVSLPDAAWSVQGLENSLLLSKNDVNGFWRGKGGMPAAGADSFVDGALNNALNTGNASSLLSQYILLEYDPATGAFSAYVRDADGNPAALEIPGLEISYSGGRINYTIPVQTPDAQENASLVVESKAVSLEKASGGAEYDFSNNISASEETGSVSVEVEALNGKVTAALAMHEDGRPRQNELAENADPATGPRNDNIETGYLETTGMPVDMRLEEAAEGEYLHSITIGELPDAATQGIIYYNGNPVSEGQTINTPAMGPDGSIPGFSFKPAPNFSGDVDFDFSYVIGSHRTGPSVLPGDGRFPMHVDSVADLAAGESDFQGRIGGGDDILMPDADTDGEGWMIQHVDPEQSIEFTFTVHATFTDLDGSEAAWIDVALPTGFSIPQGSTYELFNENGVNYARVSLPALDTLQPDGEISIPITLQMDAGAEDDAKTLQIRIVTEEQDDLDGDGHSLANNTAVRVLEQEVPLSIHSGLTIKAGWVSEDGNGAKNGVTYNPDQSAAMYVEATEGGRAAEISLFLSPRSTVPEGEDNDESLVSIVFTYDASKGVLLGYDGNPLSAQTSGPVSIIIQGDNYISPDGQSLVAGSLQFRPRANLSDADLEDVLNYRVNITSVAGEAAVYHGKTSIVVDAVADRPDNGPLDADYGSQGSDVFVATTPGGVVPVSGSSEFHDLDGSELLYVMVSIPDSAWSIQGLENSLLLSKNDLNAFLRGKGNMPAENDDSYVDAALNSALNFGNPSLSAGQFLLLEYDPATGIATVYARNAQGGNPVAVHLPDLEISYADGRLSYSIPVQTPVAQENASLNVESQAVSLEKANGGIEYDYSNNIAVSEDKGSVTVQVEVLTGRVTASLSMHEDGRPGQNQLASGADPATGPRDNDTEPGYSEAIGMSVDMRLEDAAEGEYLRSITIGELPDAVTEGVIYYNGRPVTEGQVINNPAMVVDGSIPGFSFKPVPNYSGDTDFRFSFVIGSHRTGPATLPVDGTFPVHVDSVADLASGETDFQGRIGGGDDILMPVATGDGEGWMTQHVDPEQRVEFTFTVNATFTDLDGSERAWIDVALPDGFNIPAGSDYLSITENGVTYARILLPDLSGLQGSGGVTSIPVTLEMDANAEDDAKSLQVRIVTEERDSLNGDGHSTANNTAIRVLEQEVPLSIHSGMTIKAGWVSEDGNGGKNGFSYNPAQSASQFSSATDGGSAAEISIVLSPRSTVPEGEENDESLSSIVFTYDASKGVLLGFDGNPLSAQTSGTVTITIQGPEYISPDGQSLIAGSLQFRPRANLSDADLEDVLNYSVNITSVAGESAVYHGKTSIVVDAVADRPDNGSLSADYGSAGGEDFVAASPGSVVPVSGSAEFHDLDGSELLYVMVSIPDSAWSVQGLDNALLLSKNDISALWRDKGSMPAAGENSFVDTAVNAALALGDTSLTLSQYLLLEYDPATGVGTIYARDAQSGSPVAVHLPGFELSYTNGQVNYTIPVQTPDAREKTSLTVESHAVSLEKATGGTEYDYSNNISVSEDKGTVSVEVEILTGRVVASVSLHEDGKPAQNQLAPNVDPANGSRDETTEPGYTEATGMPVSMRLEGASEGEYVRSITITDLPDASTEGVLYYQGRPLTVGQLINAPVMNADNSISGFSFKPVDNYSGDTGFSFNYVLASHNTGEAATAQQADAPVHVDSVADLASGSSALTEGANAGDVIDMPAPFFELGWAKQNYDVVERGNVAFTVRADFTDLDGSETAWILVKLPQGFSIPAGSPYTLVMDGADSYARIDLPPLTGLVSSNGHIDLPIRLSMDQTVQGESNTLEIQIITQEGDSLDSDGHSIDNNSAVRVITQEVPVNLFAGNFNLHAGWIYEDGDRTNATTNLADIYLDPDSVTASGAPVEINLDPESTLTALTMTLNPYFGKFQVNGVDWPNNAGVYTFSGGDLNGNQLTFVPSVRHTSTDAPFSYSATVTDGRGNEFTFRGDSLLVVDSVAQKADINNTVKAVAESDNDTLDIVLNTAFADVDGSEKHFILVEKQDGWTCLTENTVVTLYFDAQGNPLQPDRVDPLTGEYGYDTTNAIAKEFFKVDVTAQSTAAGGNAQNYTVRMTPPASSPDTRLQVGTLSEEQLFSISDRERDVANNQAFDFRDVDVNLVNSSLFVSALNAYEDDQPNQHLGDATVSGRGGEIFALVSQNGEYINNSPGQNIVLTFTYEGSGLPGSFVFGGDIYLFGSANYTAVGGQPGVYRLTLPAGRVAANSSDIMLRYIPPADDDHDLTNLQLSVPVKASGSDFTATITGSWDRLVIDAVADKPENVSLAPELEDSHTAAVTGSTISLDVQAAFGDYQDDSEQHYLVFDLSGGVAGVDLGSFPEIPGYSWSFVTGTELSSAGLSQFTDAARFAVVQVPNAYLRAHNGVFDSSIRVSLDTVTQDTTLNLAIRAVAVDKASDTDTDTTNNYAETTNSVNIAVHTITSVPALHAAIAYENDTRLAHVGKDGSNGAALSVTGMHASEGLTDISFSFNPSSGSLYYNGSAINIGSTNLGNGITLTATLQGGVYTVSITGGSEAVNVASYIPRLTFMPAVNYLDGDVPVTVQGTIIDKASGMTQDFNSNFRVTVDAVAQQPTAAGSDITYEDGRTAAHDHVTVTTQATFRDTGDGSESHYLLIEAKSYFDTTGMQLVTVAYDRQGRILTPAADGTRWLDPEPSNGRDTYVNPASTKTFIRIPVDNAINGYDENAGGTQTINGFTVTRNANGSYMVSYESNIPLRESGIASDFTDTLVSGGMSVESALPPGSGDLESYRYNNVGYGLNSGTLIHVAVVETRAVSLLMGRAYEQNSPLGNIGRYDTGNGGGILAVRETPDGQDDYADEQITITFTYNALYQENGQWVLPGLITYQGIEVDYSVDQTSGVVTATLVLDQGDSASIIDSTNVSTNPNTQAAQIDGSAIRFVPSTETYNETDVNLRYEISVEDTASGDTLGMGTGGGTIVIDAVADKPLITDAKWDYGTDGEGNAHTAFATNELKLSFTAEFPDTGTDGVISEGQYILVQQIEGVITLSDSLKQALALRGMTADLYPVEGDLYYRIPASFFNLSADGGNKYDVEITLTRTTALSDQVGFTAPVIMAMSIVQNPHGGEFDVSNNVAVTEAEMPPLDFAVVDTTLPGNLSSVVYENDTPNAHTGDNTPANGVEFDLGINLGPSINGGREVASDFVFTYADNRGTLSYNDGNSWIDVPSGGTVPSQYRDQLRYIPKNTHDSSADTDVPLNYRVTITDPASGASREMNGSYLIIVDAVAQKPTVSSSITVDYSDEDYSNTIGYGESATLNITAEYPDYDKVAGGHSDLYILVEKPGSAWTVDDPAITEYIYQGQSYFRIPVNPSDMVAGSPGMANLSVTLQAPTGGTLLYNNSTPLKVFALSIARDPNKGPLPGGDRGETYNNNWAYSDAASVTLAYDDPGPKFITVDPLYQNNNPDGNQLDGNGNQVVNESGGKVHLSNSYIDGSDVSHPVSSVELVWTETDGDLYVGGVRVTPDSVTGGRAHYTLTPDQFDDVYFRSKNPNSDVDFNTIEANIATTDGGSYSDSYDPTVDAVAQVPLDVQAQADYNTDPTTDYTAAVPGEIVNIDLSAKFSDLDGSEDHYILVESNPAWQQTVGYPVIDAPDGKQYIQVPVTSIDPDGTGHANLSLQVPSSGGTDIGNGRFEYTFATGAMSEQPSNKTSGNEYRDDNNVAYNLNGTVNVVTSRAESSPTLHVTNTYANGDANGDGIPDTGNNSKIYLSGLDSDSDTITELTLTYSRANGDIFYNDTALSGGTLPGVNVNPGPGDSVTLTINNTDVINALLAGNASRSEVQYVSNNYNNADVPIRAEVQVQDRFSEDSNTVVSTPEILVDAVARRPENVSAEITSPDNEGAVPPNTVVTFEIKASFPDFGGDGVPGNHYLALQQVSGWSPVNLPQGVVTESYNGVTYYLISADIYGPGGTGTSPALQYDPATQMFTFTMQLRSPNSTTDVPNLTNIEGGALTTIDVQSDLDLKNNLNINSEEIPLAIGVVETTSVDFTFSPVQEDSAAGSSISLSQATLNDLAKHNEKVTDSEFTFAGNFAGKPTDSVVGTIIYDGKAYNITSSGNGTSATADVDFGPEGYDSSKDFKVVWGTVATNGDGTVQTDVSGNPVVTEWNHTGGNMNVEVSSTVVDKASNDSRDAVTGSGSAAFTPAANAPTGLTVNDPNPVGSGVPVSFTMSGTFADTDGSEAHYFLVEQKEGWSGPYETVTHNGVSYFQIPVNSSTDPNPTVNVTLYTPENISDDGVINLKTGGLAQDGDSSAYTDGRDVSIPVSVVNATGVNLNIADTSEDSPARMTFSLEGGNNDSISSVTVTNLNGGSLVDVDGNVLVSAGQLPATLDVNLVRNGGYYYKPPAYGSGDFNVTFTTTVTDNASGVTKDFTGQTGSVNVSPTTNTPEDASGSTEAAVNQPGHTATVNVALNAFFPDNDGSEEHFFLVTLPAGLTAPDGWSAVTDATLLAAAGLNGQTVYKIAANQAGEAAFTLTLPENYSGTGVNYKAGSVETATLTEAQPDYRFLDGSAVNLPVTREININPTVSDASGTMTDALRNPGQLVNGALVSSDADGDSITVSGLTYNGTQASQSGTTLMVNGSYGTLSIDTQTGSYSYTLTSRPPDGFREEFDVSVSDGHGGSASSVIGITLNAPNMPPAPQQISEEATGESGTVISGAIDITDPENDAVSIADVQVNGTSVTVGQGGIYTHVGLYGTFEFHTDGSYTYTLTDSDATGIDILAVSLQDMFGATSTSVITVNVTPRDDSGTFSLASLFSEPEDLIPDFVNPMLHSNPFLFAIDNDSFVLPEQKTAAVSGEDNGENGLISTFGIGMQTSAESTDAVLSGMEEDFAVEQALLGSMTENGPDGSGMEDIVEVPQGDLHSGQEISDLFDNSMNTTKILTDFGG